jgi:hypothetical protein
LLSGCPRKTPFELNPRKPGAGVFARDIPRNKVGQLRVRLLLVVLSILLLHLFGLFAGRVVETRIVHFVPLRGSRRNVFRDSRGSVDDIDRMRYSDDRKVWEDQALYAAS